MSNIVCVLQHRTVPRWMGTNLLWYAASVFRDGDGGSIETSRSERGKYVSLYENEIFLHIHSWFTTQRCQ